MYLLFTKAFCKSRSSCAEIGVYHNVRHHICSLKSTYAGRFIFDLHMKFFLDFAARKRNIFSRPAHWSNEGWPCIQESYSLVTAE
jgi:hypothetical protein